MKVANFMTPADKAITASPFDTIGKVMALMQEHKVGSIVVLHEEPHVVNQQQPDLFARPLGIITKSDILRAYNHKTHTSVQDPCRKIMHTDLAVVTPHMSRNQAAAIMQRNKIHHAVVIDDEDHGRFAGVISSMDIASECAKDHLAWPWNRSEDGKLHR